MSYYEPLTYIVSPEEEGIQLKTILKSRMQLSRRLLSRLKRTEKGITVNGERQYINVPVRAGDLIEIHMEQEQSDDILPEPIPLDIIYEDAYLLIVNKPAGMIVHPTHGHYVHTLANGVVHHWLERGEKVRFRPVHRLDQDTSGVLAIAKNPFVHQHISEQMKAQEVLKEYRALVHGEIQADEGTIDAPIDRDPEQPHYRIVTRQGYPAVTHYRVVERLNGATLASVRLETGRTHQIRVHMLYIGHPLIGDKIYPPEGGPPLPEGAAIDRQALHAHRLGFVHPGTKRAVEFQAELPPDMNRLRQALSSAANPANSHTIDYGMTGKEE
ncbi:RluA family pseudouridine synthase [Paenibacillus sp. J2TS4]|uniref:RluA family pseudouridine synthase n=1 Tax=Paenibacillus sp. J2TS4 TaxID=2807194 RepID=UPI001B2870D5|nr:RluA family pseudouridine synthase [Paenibacillus sp. J2TS4]GIP34360.1 RNA pseudouridine synthase [Paenibacillus sp. J2TS4]